MAKFFFFQLEHTIKLETMLQDQPTSINIMFQPMSPVVITTLLHKHNCKRFRDCILHCCNTIVSISHRHPYFTVLWRKDPAAHIINLQKRKKSSGLFEFLKTNHNRWEVPNQDAATLPLKNSKKQMAQG